MGLSDERQSFSRDLTIAIVNWNTEKYLLACLNSIMGNVKNITYEVIIADNGSSDGSQEAVKNEFPGVSLIENRQNLGYAKANNRIFSLAKGRNLLLLNPDTLILKDSLEAMVKLLDSSGDCAGVCPKLLNPDGSFQRLYKRWPNLKVFICKQALLLPRLIPAEYKDKIMRGYLYSLPGDRFDRVRDLEQPPASCLMLKMRILKDIGLFDERFPLFFNDVDLCRRIHNNGYKIYFLPDARIVHFLGKGHDIKRKMENREFFIGWLKYLKKHNGLLAYGIAEFILFCEFTALTGVNLLFDLFQNKKRSRLRNNLRFRLEILFNKTSF